MGSDPEVSDSILLKERFKFTACRSCHDDARGKRDASQVVVVAKPCLACTFYPMSHIATGVDFFAGITQKLFDPGTFSSGLPAGSGECRVGDLWLYRIVLQSPADSSNLGVCESGSVEEAGGKVPN